MDNILLGEWNKTAGGTPLAAKSLLYWEQGAHLAIATKSMSRW
jgi:hypothetical protein